MLCFGFILLLSHSFSLLFCPIRDRSVAVVSIMFFSFLCALLIRVCFVHCSPAHKSTSLKQ